MDHALEPLLRHPGIWRAGTPRSAGGGHLPTGFPELDAALAGGGWPLGALSEIFHEGSGIGELRLLMPVLARLSRGGRWIALIAPPYIPYAPALASYGVDLSRLLLVHPRDATDALWAVEQALRSGTCGAVLAWPSRVDDRSLRRLQLAAGQGDTLGLLLRSGAVDHSPAALRLRLEHSPQGLVARLLKCRGGMHRQQVILDLERLSRCESEVTSARPATAGPASSPPAAGASRPPARRSPGGRRRAAQIELALPAAPAGDEGPALPCRGRRSG